MGPATDETLRWHLRPAVELVEGPEGPSLLVGHELVTVRAVGVEVAALLSALGGPGVVRAELAAGTFGDGCSSARLLDAMHRRGLAGVPWAAVSDPSIRQVPYYSLFEVDPVLAHRRISGARVAIVGLGGIGGPVAVDLVAAGVDDLVIADFDTVEVSNLNRQHTYDLDCVGSAKVDVLAGRLRRIRPEVTVAVVQKRIAAVDDLVLGPATDLVVCAADSPAEIADICVEVASRCGAATAFAGVGLGRGFVGPILPPGSCGRRSLSTLGEPTPFSFGPANQVVASILSAEVLRYLATTETRLASSRLVVDTLRWNTAVHDLAEGASL